MSGFFRKPFRFGIVYGVALCTALTFALLDTFVIPKSLAIVPDKSAASFGGTAPSPASSEPTDAAPSEDASSEISALPSSSPETSSDVPSEPASPITGVFTKYSYTDENLSVTITELREYDTTIYAVDVVLSDVSQLRTAFANNTYGRNIKQTTSAMAADHAAILAINGDYYGFRNSGYVLRNGVLYRSSVSGSEDLSVMADGTFRIIEEAETSAAALKEQGAVQIFSFGPSLVNGGAITVDPDTEVDRAKTSNPRTAIGMISPLHYVFLVSDGRTEESEGLSLYQLASVFQEKGCTVAYNLDGGGSSTLWFNGRIVNHPTDGVKSGERKVSDIVYIGY